MRVGDLKQQKGEDRPILGNRIRDETQSESLPTFGEKRETRFDLYPESWTFFKRDSVISGIELDS